MNVIKLAKGIKKTLFSLIILFHGIFLSAQIFTIPGGIEPSITFTLQETFVSSSEIHLYLTSTTSNFPISSGWKASLVLYKNLYCGDNIDIRLSFEAGIEVHETNINMEGEIELEISKLWPVIPVNNSIVISDISTKRYSSDISLITDGYAAVCVIEPVSVTALDVESTSVIFNEVSIPVTYGLGCGLHSIPVGFRSSGEEANSSSSLPTTTAIYPTLVSDYLQIDVATDENVDLQVFDISGQQLLSQLDVQANSYLLNVSPLPNGTYFLSIRGNGKQVGLQKFIVKK